MRKVELATGEIYHIVNRGVDKRSIFNNKKDLERFFECMSIFNSTKLTGSLYEHGFIKNKTEGKPLVKFIAYNLLPNHFHFILEQVVDGGISKFMKRLQGGYSWYFNKKNKRSGALFQGRFKSEHVDSNEYLLHLSVYVNLNDKQQASLGDPVAKLGKSSWNEYIDPTNTECICVKKDVILEQFKSNKDYEKFAISTLEDIKINKEKYSELSELEI